MTVSTFRRRDSLGYISWNVSMWRTDVCRETASAPHSTHMLGFFGGGFSPKHLRTRVTHQDDDLCLREARTQHFGDGQDSSRHLFRRVLVIVRPYPQHHHLGQDQRHFSGLLRTVATPRLVFI